MNGPDFNNYVSCSTGATIYYHRGSSPLDDECIKVGCIDSSTYSSSLDQKADFSCGGNGVDIWAPGANIISCTSNINRFGNVVYNLDSGFNQLRLSGTSQASPQVCGLAALYLQANPSATPYKIKKWVTNVASTSGVIYTTNNVSNYTDYRDTLSISNRFLFNPFNNAAGHSISGGLTLTNGVVTLI